MTVNTTLHVLDRGIIGDLVERDVCWDYVPVSREVTASISRNWDPMDRRWTVFMETAFGFPILRYDHEVGTIHFMVVDWPTPPRPGASPPRCR